MIFNFKKHPARAALGSTRARNTLKFHFWAVLQGAQLVCLTRRPLRSRPPSCRQSSCPRWPSQTCPARKRRAAPPQPSESWQSRECRGQPRPSWWPHWRRGRTPCPRGSRSSCGPCSQQPCAASWPVPASCPARPWPHRSRGCR